MKILSIDDSKSVHAFLKICFSATSCELDFAMSGEEGLEVLEKKQGAYDLVLLDWEMPGLQGPDVLKKIKATWKETPVVMLTSKNDNDEILEVLGLGALEYVIKPFTQDILLEKIGTALGREIEVTNVAG